MKRIISLILVVLSAFMFTSCGNKGNDNNKEAYSKEDVAVTIAKEFGFTGGDYIPEDYKGEENKDYISAVASRDIFGPFGKDYTFNQNSGLKRKEFAKIALQTYAALEGVEVFKLAPGKPVTAIGNEEELDISELNYQEKWYVYSANTYGFVRFDKDKNFRPDDFVTPEEVAETITKIKKRNKTQGQTFEQYKTLLEENFRIYTPENTKVADVVDTIKYDWNITHGERLAFATLQGLANRGRARVYVLNSVADSQYNSGGLDWYLQYAKDKKYVAEVNQPFTKLDDFVAKYKTVAKGIVVYPNDDNLLINLAVDYAAVTDSIVIDDTMISRAKEWGFTEDKIVNVADLNLGSFTEYQLYAYNNLFQFMRRDALMYVFGGDNDVGINVNTHDFERDFSVQQKLPTIWIPNFNLDYADLVQAEIGTILENFPANIPVLGFQHCQVGSVQLGLGEQAGNSFCGTYGKYTTVNDLTPNSSFNTCIPVKKENKKFTPVEVETPEFDPSKKYVSLIMTESTDSPFYIGSLFKARQWDDVEARKEVPFSYALGLSNYDLYPLMLQYWNETKLPGDNFFGGISGLGYCYPLIDFGDNGVVDETGRTYFGRKEIIADHYEKTNWMLKKIGFDTICIYDYSDGWWSDSDYEFFENDILSKLTSVKNVCAGMARGLTVDLTGKEINKTLANDVCIFHTCTPFDVNAYGTGPQDTSKDEIATKNLEEIILSSTKEGNFFSCMAYSWSYGPRRLKLVIDKFKVEHPEYVFVRSDVLSNIYRSANQGK